MVNYWVVIYVKYLRRTSVFRVGFFEEIRFEFYMEIKYLGRREVSGLEEWVKDGNGRKEIEEGKEREL